MYTFMVLSLVIKHKNEISVEIFGVSFCFKLLSANSLV